MNGQAEDQTYNGYKNYETWAVSMWLDGNYDGEGTYADVQMLAELHADVGMGRNRRLAEALEEYTKDRHGDVFESASLVTDLFSAALSEVDWLSLAESLLEEYSR